MASSEEYTMDDLMQDLNFLIKNGLVDARLENGEWVYAISERGLSVTEEMLDELLDEDEQ